MVGIVLNFIIERLIAGYLEIMRRKQEQQVVEPKERGIIGLCLKMELSRLRMQK
jgi:tRNA 2-selenouridine synthase SelU